jgi:hypothetical protein
MAWLVPTSRTKLRAAYDSLGIQRVFAEGDAFPFSGPPTERSEAERAAHGTRRRRPHGCRQRDPSRSSVTGATGESSYSRLLAEVQNVG